MSGSKKVTSLLTISASPAIRLETSSNQEKSYSQAEK